MHKHLHPALGAGVLHLAPRSLGFSLSMLDQIDRA